MKTQLTKGIHLFTFVILQDGGSLGGASQNGGPIASLPSNERIIETINRVSTTFYDSLNKIIFIRFFTHFIGILCEVQRNYLFYTSKYKVK